MTGAALPMDQLTGVDEGHLVSFADGHRLRPDAVAAFAALAADALEAGFQLAVASSFRSFSRQLAIFNGKARGERPVHDDHGRPVAMAGLDPSAQLQAILRFSALPGTSRHHWGTDLDVFDAAALPEGYRVQLLPEEVAPGGMFDALHCWLDARMAAGESHGFYRPYAIDRGGVAPERWHLSYAPLARGCEAALDAQVLRECWDRHAPGDLALREEIERELPRILDRFVHVPADWCPAGAGGGRDLL